MQNNLESNPGQGDDCSAIADEFQKNLTLADDHVEEEVEEDEDEEDDDGDFEFSFAGSELSSPVAAEEVFHNGQIRPIFPFSDDQVENSDEATTSYGPPVKKLFVVEDEDVVQGPYCAWSANSPENSPAPAPEMSRKSNSTGFSKLWKVKDLLVRSHSDGKDAFVFLNGKNDETASSSVEEDSKKESKKKGANLAKIKVETTPSGEKKTKKKTTKSAYEALYGKREKKVGKSYLPYRQDLVGFFTNSNGITRNVHPY